MKFIKSILMLAAVFVFAAAPASAQDPQEDETQKPVLYYGLANHLGVGISAGIMDGAGISVAVPLGPQIQIRGGYNYIPDVSVYTVDDMGSYKVNGVERQFKDVSVSINTGTYFGLVDLYPSRKAAFHFTLGAYGSSNGDLFGVKADASKILDPSEYASAFIELNDDATGERVRISSDKDGFINANLRAKNKLRPYVGFGWGRTANIKHAVSVSFDLGLQYAGGVEAIVYDYDGNPQALTSGLVEHKDSFSGQDDIIDQIAEGKLYNGLVGSWWPVVKIGLNIRLF